MGNIIGIDLGTTNSAMAALVGGQPEIITNAEGARTTPSVVAFTGEGQHLVGAVARRQAATNPQNTIFSVKRFMGRRRAEASAAETLVPYRLGESRSGDLQVVTSGGTYSPPEVSAMILAKLKADAEAYLGQEVSEAVITVPAYFDDAQRQATQDAGRIAGLGVRRIVNEPTAAALAYGLKQDEEQTVLVVDLGGGTLDVSVLESGDGVFEVRSTAGDNHLGGDDFDGVLVQWLADQFQSLHAVDLRRDPLALQRLYEAAEKAKIELSASSETTIVLPFISANAQGPLHLELSLSRARLEQLGARLLDRLLPPLRQALQDAEAKGAGALDQLLLVGGMTRMPAVRRQICELVGLEARDGVHPEEVVALGAAVQGGVLAGEVRDVVLLDVTPLTLGLETRGGLMTRLIERNTTVPASHAEIFSTAEDNQSSVEIHILQGEREMAEGNKSLGRFQLTDIPPAASGAPQIEVRFDIDADGILSVSAQDLHTGRSQAVQVHAATGMPEAEILQAIAQAEHYAATDRERRRLAEAHNQHRALLTFVDRQISAQAGRLLPADAQRLQQQAHMLRQALVSGSEEAVAAAATTLHQLWSQIAPQIELRAQAQDRLQQQAANSAAVDAELLE